MRKITFSSSTADITCIATATRRNKFSSGFKFLSILLLVLLVSGKSWGQVTLPHLDPINYTVGQGLQTQTNWTSLNSGDALLISTGNLSYNGFISSTGNKVSFDGAGIDAAKLFTQQTSGTLYYSFLLNVTSLGSLNTTGGYFSGFNEGTGSTFGSTIWLRSDGAGYDIGINPRTTAANTVWSSGTTSINTTLLVVISYQIVSGTANDVVNMWINPTPGSSLPTPTLTSTNTGTDLANLNRILIRQDGTTATPFIEMDEFRISTSWSEVTPASGLTTPPTLTSASSPTVDAAFDVTFTDDASSQAWVSAGGTAVTVGGTALTAGYAISNGKITFTPSASVPAGLLQTAGASKAIVISKTGYSNATVSQTILAGAANKLAMKTQPTAPASNGAVLAVQPAVNIVDQYGNATTSTASVSASVGAGSWTLGGTTSVAASTGTTTFSGLTATSAAAVTGATIAFTSTELTGVTSNTFNIPSPPPANDECSSAVDLTVDAAAISTTNVNATKSTTTTLSGTSAYTTGTAKDVWYTFTTSTCTGNHTITVTPTGFDVAFALFTGSCPNPTLIQAKDAGGSGVAEAITTSLTANTTYQISVWGYSSASGSFTVGVASAVTPQFTLANTGSPAIGNIASGTNNVAVFGFSLTPTACTNSFDFTAANISTSGTATSSDFSNFRLILDANNNGIADAGEISSPIATVASLANSLVFTGLAQTNLVAATRYLLIADVAVGATGGNTFTGSLTNANTTATVSVTGTATGNIQTVTAGSIAIVDNGTQITSANILRGINSNIISKAQLTVSGQNSTVTNMSFVTAGVSGGYTSAQIATNGFKLWMNTSNDFGTASQVGSGVSSAKSTATNTETLSFATTQTLNVGTTYYYWLTVDVASTATVAKTITVNGLSNTSITSAGTTITGTTSASGAQTIIAPTVVIANNTTITAANILLNSTNNVIARAQLTISNANVTSTSLTFVTAASSGAYTSSDIATNGFKLWYSTTNSFSGATQFGSSITSAKATANTTETLAFTSTQTLSSASVYYFWLTADIAAAPAASKTITVSALSSSSFVSSTTGVAISGSTSSSGAQTIIVPTLTIANNTQVSTQNLFVNTTNNIISKALFTVTNATVALSDMSFVTAANATGYTSSDIASGGFKLWVTTGNTFTSPTQIGTGQSSTKATANSTETITFTTDQTLTIGSYYYWLTADIASGAVASNILIVNGLTSASATATTTGAVIIGTASATSSQTITVPTVTIANTGSPATGSIAVGSSSLVLFGFSLTPNTLVDFTAASITTSGTATSSDLSNFRLIYDANADGAAAVEEISASLGTVSTLTGTLTFSGISGQTAFSSARRYLLIADAASGATSGNTFTASLSNSNITTSAVTTTTNTGSAEGNAQTLANIPIAGDILINQLNPGYTTASNEYIELVNTTAKTFDMSGLKIVYYSSGGTVNNLTVGVLSGTMLPNSFWLLATGTVTVGNTTSLTADGTFSGGMAANNGQISLQRVSDNVQIDGVAYGNVNPNVISEGSTAPAGTTAPSVSIKRTLDGADTNVNSSDFSTVVNGSIYLRNSSSRLANTGATIATGTYTDLIVTGASDISGNVTTSKLSINSGSTFSVPSAKQLTVSSTLTNNGTLNLKSDASGTATMITPTTISGSGTTNVEQYLGTMRNWYISSPVTNALAPSGFTYYKRNETGATWLSPTFSIGDAFVPGTGYIALPNATGTKITFSTQSGGKLNSGSVDVVLTKGSTTKAIGYNLIGNPYPCHLAWTSAFVNDVTNAAKIEPTIWIRSNAGSVNNGVGAAWSYITYNGYSGAAVPNYSILSGGIIPPMQAFWVRAITAGTLTLDSKLTRSHQASNPLKALAVKNTENQSLRMQVSNDTNSDELLVYFNANAKDSYDAYDSPKMTNANTAIPEIYTTVGGEQLVINGLNSAVIANRELPLGFTTGTNNNFTIKATEISNFDADTRVILKDNLLKSEYELNLGNAYNFSSDVVNTTSRFSIVFRSATGPNALYNNVLESLYITKNANNQITINGLGAKDGMVTVCNAVGQKLISTALTGSSLVIDKPFSTGVYLVTVNVGNAKVTKKVIVN